MAESLEELVAFIYDNIITIKYKTGMLTLVTNMQSYALHTLQRRIEVMPHHPSYLLSEQKEKCNSQEHTLFKHELS